MVGFIRVIIPVALVLVFCGSAAAQSETQYPAYALLVGSAEPGEGQKELRYVHSDVASLRSVLLELGGYSPDTIEVLRDPEPGELYQALHGFRALFEQLEQRGEKAVFLFYYSGHARSNSLNLGPRDVPLSKLRTAFENLPATVKVVILDACQAGAMSGVIAD